MNLKRVKIKLSGTPELKLHLLGFEENKLQSLAGLQNRGLAVLSLWPDIDFYTPCARPLALGLTLWG